MEVVQHYLGKHGLPVLSDHGALVTVQCDAGVVEGLLGVLQDVAELCDASFKNRAEVTGDQRPADRCRETAERHMRGPSRSRVCSPTKQNSWSHVLLSDTESPLSVF